MNRLSDFSQIITISLRKKIPTLNNPKVLLITIVCSAAIFLLVASILLKRKWTASALLADKAKTKEIVLKYENKLEPIIEKCGNLHNLYSTTEEEIESRKEAVKILEEFEAALSDQSKISDANTPNLFAIRGYVNSKRDELAEEHQDEPLARDSSGQYNAVNWALQSYKWNDPKWNDPKTFAFMKYLTPELLALKGSSGESVLRLLIINKNIIIAPPGSAVISTLESLFSNKVLSPYDHEYKNQSFLEFLVESTIKEMTIGKSTIGKWLIEYILKCLNFGTKEEYTQHLNTIFPKIVAWHNHRSWNNRYCLHSVETIARKFNIHLVFREPDSDFNKEISRWEWLQSPHKEERVWHRRPKVMGRKT